MNMVNTGSSGLGVRGVILAGGRSRRYGTDKAFALLAGASLIGHVMTRAAPQVEGLVISGAAPGLADFGLPVVADEAGAAAGSTGPLAGVLAALDWLVAAAPEARWLATFPVDAPFIPLDMVACLRAAAERAAAPMACSRSAGRVHPLHALWAPHLAAELRAALRRGERAVQAFVEQQGAAIVDFPDDPIDPFANINTPGDLERAARHCTAPPPRRSSVD